MKQKRNEPKPPAINKAPIATKILQKSLYPTILTMLLKSKPITIIQNPSKPPKIIQTSSFTWTRHSWSHLPTQLTKHQNPHLAESLKPKNHYTPKSNIKTKHPQNFTHSPPQLNPILPVQQRTQTQLNNSQGLTHKTHQLLLVFT